MRSVSERAGSDDVKQNTLVPFAFLCSLARTLSLLTDTARATSSSNHPAAAPLHRTRSPPSAFPNPHTQITMPLSRQINADKVLKQAREHSATHRHGRPTVHEMLGRDSPSSVDRHPNAATDYGTSPVPKYQIPSKGVSAAEAYAICNNELSLDGNPLYAAQSRYSPSSVLTLFCLPAQSQPRCKSCSSLAVRAGRATEKKDLPDCSSARSFAFLADLQPLARSRSSTRA